MLSKAGGQGIKEDLSIVFGSYCQGIGLVKMFVWVFPTQTSFFGQSNILVNLKKKKNTKKNNDLNMLFFSVEMEKM